MLGSTIFLSGVDILDGTPVLDIKPYIPSYDIPPLDIERDYFSNKETISSKNSAGIIYKYLFILHIFSLQEKLFIILMT